MIFIKLNDQNVRKSEQPNKMSNEVQKETKNLTSLPDSQVSFPSLHFEISAKKYNFYVILTKKSKQIDLSV